MVADVPLARHTAAQATGDAALRAEARARRAGASYIFTNVASGFTAAFFFTFFGATAFGLAGQCTCCS